MPRSDGYPVVLTDVVEGTLLPRFRLNAQNVSDEQKWIVPAPEPGYLPIRYLRRH